MVTARKVARVHRLASSLLLLLLSLSLDPLALKMLARNLIRAARPALSRATVRPALLAVARAPAAPLPLARTLSTSLPRFEPCEPVPRSTPLLHTSLIKAPTRTCAAALSTKLGEELNFETESGDANAEPEFLQAFKAEGVWQVVDEQGSDEIQLTRSFGNERCVPGLPARILCPLNPDPSVNNSTQHPHDLLHLGPRRRARGARGVR